MRYLGRNTILSLFCCCAIALAGCGKAKPDESSESSQDSGSETPARPSTPSFNRVPGYKERLNKVLDDGAAEREKRVQEIFQ